MLTAIGALFSLVILFSACSDDKLSAPSAVSENPVVITPDITSSSREETVPTSSEIPQSSAEAIPQLSAEAIPQSSADAIPQSSADAIPQSSAEAIPQSSADAIPQSSADAIPLSSESRKSSSSVASPQSSNSLPDGNYYNPGACCADTAYIENGKVVRTHASAPGICPPPSVILVTCVPPVRIDLDSIREAETKINKNSPTIKIYECLARSDALLKKGLDSLKKALPIEYTDGSAEIEYWQNKYCTSNAALSFDLSGDTLSVNLAENSLSANCNLYCRSRLNIPDSLQDFSYFKFEGFVYGLW